MNGRFAENPAYVQYETLLKRLHGLIAEGQGQSPEADAVREAMDEPVERLTRPEITRLKGLSADLYMLQGKEVITADAGSRLELEELRSELDHFRDWNSWDAVLALLRRRASDIPEAAVAATRARAYAELGHADTALLFLDFAFRATPDDADYKTLRLMLLLDAGRYGEAVKIAESALASNDTTPELIFAAADVLFATAVAQSQKADGDDRTYARVLEVLGRLVGGRQTRRPLLPSFLVLAHLLRAACLSHFDRANEAIGACDEALKIAPNDDVVLQMRSLIQAGSSDGSFKAAVRNALNRFKMSAWNGATLSAA